MAVFLVKSAQKYCNILQEKSETNTIFQLIYRQMPFGMQQSMTSPGSRFRILQTHSNPKISIGKAEIG